MYKYFSHFKSACSGDVVVAVVDVDVDAAEVAAMD